METDGTGALAIIPNNATLFGKMAQVMKLVSRVPKNGFNTFHKYKYAMADDVADCIRDAMGESNLALFVEMGEPNQETIEGDNNNKKMIRTTIRFIFTFACGDTGATMSKTWVGQVDDNSDKAISKCATAAEKYFLMKTFIVSAGDEPDADSDKHREEAGRRVAPKWHAEDRVLHELSERAFTAGYIKERNGKGVAELVAMIEPKTWDDFTDRNAAALAIKEIGEAAKAAKAAAKVKPPEPEITEPGAAALANGLTGKSPFGTDRDDFVPDGTEGADDIPANAANPNYRKRAEQPAQ